jgi:hypothetical protein
MVRPEREGRKSKEKSVTVGWGMDLMQSTWLGGLTGWLEGEWRSHVQYSIVPVDSTRFLALAPFGCSDGYLREQTRAWR